MSFIRIYQLDIMLYMSGICGILALLTMITESLSGARKSVLFLMEFSAMLLLLFDRASYTFRGDTSDLGFMMVRISNGLVFFLCVFIPHLVTQYLKDLYREEGSLATTPFCLKASDILFVFGTALIVVSQFTGLYYTFDEQNIYHRASGFAFSYTVPMLIVFLQIFTLVQNRRRLNRRLTNSMILCIALPTVFSVVQIFNYGISLTNMTMVFMVIAFYIYALIDMSREMRLARKNEIESYKETERIKEAMFEQTAEALANAIDAKDQYTHGHSTRVAALSRQIAKEAGYSEKDCEQIYFAALLHDVGKIGIRDEIINKKGRLTQEEFEQIKQHPILGYQILSSIKQSPALSVGAHYHHERFDGSGYPDGLSGESIPETARIIAVADAYDAMTSSRSYRGKLSREKTRAELIAGKGKQFDPKFADIMLHILDREDALSRGQENTSEEKH